MVSKQGVLSWTLLFALGMAATAYSADANAHGDGGGEGCGTITEWTTPNSQGGYNFAHTGTGASSSATTGWDYAGYNANRNRPGEVILYWGWADQYPSHGFCW